MSAGDDPRSLPAAALARIARRAVAEDLGAGDLTTSVLGLAGTPGSARLVFREAGVLAGVPVARAVAAAVDPALRIDEEVSEGTRVAAGACVLRASGDLASLLAAERVMLNFVQRLSGIATWTRAFVDAVAGTRARILDTRKTTPLLRMLERYAVRIGGGVNHRFGLHDGILVKDNHVVACGGVAEASRRAMRGAPPLARVCVEVEDLPGLEAALQAGVPHVLLDNFPVEVLPAAAARCHEAGATCEASGGMSLETVAAVAATGVDFISVGALTHSARAIDVSLEMEPPR